MNLIEENVALFDLELVLLGITIDICERRRKDVNIAIVVGAGVGILAGAGLITAFTALTAGVAVPFIIAGSVITISGSLTTSISSIVDCVGSMKMKKITALMNEIHSQKSEEMKRLSEKLDDQLKRFYQDYLDETMVRDNIPNVVAAGRPLLSYFRIVQGVASNATVTPLVVLRNASIVTTAVGSVLAAVGIAFDGLFFALAIRNLIHRNRTEFSTSQRQSIKLIQFTKRMYQLILDGN